MEWYDPDTHNYVYGATLIQADDYYPFGLKMPDYSYIAGGAEENKFTYNGKELEDEFGLNWYHYGWRFYDPVVGRWWAVDPMDQFITPYTYVGNNPIMLVDPDGASSSDPPGFTMQMLLNYLNTFDYTAGGLLDHSLAGIKIGADNWWGNLTGFGKSLLTWEGQRKFWFPSFSEIGDKFSGLWQNGFVKPTQFWGDVISGEYSMNEGFQAYFENATPGLIDGGIALAGLKLSSGVNINAGQFQFSVMSRTTSGGMSGHRILGYKYGKFQAAIDYHNWPLRSLKHMNQGYTGIQKKFWHYHFGTGRRGSRHMQFGTGLEILDSSQLRNGIFGYY